MGRLDDKVALITGGARGQGAAEAELFAAEGATVFITDVLEDEGKATAERLGDAVTFMAHDVTSVDDWEAVLASISETAGRLDVLVNNAGIFQVMNMAETSLDDWNRMIAINQTGVFLGMKLAAEIMKPQGSGSMINISSIAGLSGAGMAHAYSASKWAIRGMTKSAALELAGTGVRVNSVHPGIIDTAMLREFGPAEDVMAARIPLGRTAEASEVANLVLFLASEESSYCTGHEFVVDGGFNA